TASTNVRSAPAFARRPEPLPTWCGEYERFQPDARRRPRREQKASAPACPAAASSPALRHDFFCLWLGMNEPAPDQLGHAQGTRTVALELLPQAAWIFLDSCAGQPVGSVIDGICVAPEETLLVVAGVLFAGEARIQDAFLTGHHFLFAGAVGGVRVVMILMDNQYRPGCIDHLRVQRARFPEQPVVPPEAADGQRRDGRVKATREREVINAAGNLQLALAAGATADLRHPV